MNTLNAFDKLIGSKDGNELYKFWLDMMEAEKGIHPNDLKWGVREGRYRRTVKLVEFPLVVSGNTNRYLWFAGKHYNYREFRGLFVFFAYDLIKKDLRYIQQGQQVPYAFRSAILDKAYDFINKATERECKVEVLETDWRIICDSKYMKEFMEYDPLYKQNRKRQRALLRR